MKKYRFRALVYRDFDNQFKILQTDTEESKKFVYENWGTVFFNPESKKVLKFISIQVIHVVETENQFSFKIVGEVYVHDLTQLQVKIGNLFLDEVKSKNGKR